MKCESRGKGNKTGVAMLVISLSLLHKTRDTPNRVDGRFQKSFDMNNWHLLRKGEKL